MTLSISEIPGVLFVALIWGFTNPLMKIAADKKFIAHHPSSKLQHVVFGTMKTLNDLGLPLTLSVFLFNQIGSAVFLLMLGDGELSVLVPCVNALTLISTLGFGWKLGEDSPPRNTLKGVALVSIGVILCSM